GVVSRNVPALESVVISVGHIGGGSIEALNVMPSELVVGGTMRAFNAPMQALLERRIRELAELSAATQGASAETRLWWNAVPLLNHGPQTEAAFAAARRVAGDDGVDAETAPVTGGEDFAFMLQAK